MTHESFSCNASLVSVQLNLFNLVFSRKISYCHLSSSAAAAKRTPSLSNSVKLFKSLLQKQSKSALVIASKNLLLLPPCLELRQAEYV